MGTQLNEHNNEDLWMDQWIDEIKQDLSVDQITFDKGM